MITLAGYPVIRGRISFPEVGTWVTVADIAADGIPQGKVVIDDGAGTQLHGCVIPPGGVLGTKSSVRVVGGAGGIRKTQESRPFRSATLATVLSAILGDAGETQSREIYPNVLTKFVKFWSTQAGTGGSNLSTLCETFGFQWRVKPDGKIWVGTKTEEMITPGEALITAGEPSLGRYRVAPEGLWLQPGMTQSSARVARVIYDIGDTIRATYWIDA